MFRKILISLLLALTCLAAKAQYTQIGTGLFGSANFGPLRTDTVPSHYSKFAFTYPEASLSSMSHGDTVRAVSFFFDAFDSLRGNCNLRILLASSGDADFGPGALNWDSVSRTDAIEVYSGNPKTILGNVPGEAQFLLQQPYRWDTTGGKVNLRVFVEYVQSTNQAGIFAWNVENGFSVPAFVSPNESKFLYGISNNGIDSISNRNALIKPTIKLYHPTVNDDLEVNRIYSLGTIPLLMRRADTIKAVITNLGLDTIISKKVYLNVRGANTFLDSIVVSNVAPYEKVNVRFANYIAQNIGTETLVVRVASDDNATNDSIAKPRIVNYNNYSHNDPFATTSGGIGFNGSTGDFVAKFYVQGTSYINQIKVDFNRANQPFQLVVWNDDGIGGKPGTEIFVSDTVLSVVGTFIMPVLPRIAVSNGYYVGIRQSSNTNVSFTFQEENPIRPHTFYFTAPAGDTTWTNFDPGFNFNFNIQPRLQVANDVAVLDFISPIAGDSILYSDTDSIDLIARIINFGYQNQGSFIVRGQIYNQFNQLEETRTAVISLPAEDTAVVDFGKLSKFRLGNYTFRVIAQLSLDSVTDNNQGEIEFTFIKEFDVAVDQIFSPSPNESFELLRDPIQAIVRLSNYGVKSHTNLPVILQFLNANSEVVYTQAKLVNIGPLTTQILAFDTTYLTLNGNYTLRAYTDLATDSFRINDTMFVNPIIGVKTDDLKITEITRPTENEKFAKNQSIRPFVRYLNDGTRNQDSVVIEATITNANDEIIYYDSMHESVSFFSIKQALFKPVTLDSLGDYTFFTRVTIAEDQLPDNDTASTRFSVVTGNDLRLVAVLNPNGTIPINAANANVEIVAFNAGLNDIVSAPISVAIEDNTGSSTYNDLRNVSLATGVTDTISFKLLNFDNLGDFYVTVTNDWSLEDERQSSDTIYSSFITRYSSDLGIVSHLLPKDTLEIGEVTRPRFSVLNSGIDTVKNINIKVNILDAAGAILFADTVSPPNMGSNVLFNVNTNETWSWNDGGMFTLRSEILNADNNSDNDILNTTFVLAKRRDLSVLSVSGPVNAENITKGSVYKPVASFQNEGLQDVIGAEVICDVKVGLITIYRNRQPISIPVGNSTTIEFDSSMSYPTVAEATAEFRVEYAQDQLATNDTLTTTFNFVQGASITELNPQLVEVYPNPVVNSFELRTSLIMNAVSIKNDLGVEVFTNLNVNASKLTISMDELTSGTYYIEISTNEGVVLKQLLKL